MRKPSLLSAAPAYGSGQVIYSPDPCPVPRAQRSMGRGLMPVRPPGMAQLREAVALVMLLHHLPKFLSCTCAGAFSDTATRVSVGC